MHSLRMNPLSYSGRSGRLNFFVYGLVVPVLLTSVMTALDMPALLKIFLVLLVAVMFLASVVRRGKDIGLTETRTLLILFLSFLLVVAILTSMPSSVMNILDSEYPVLSPALFKILGSSFLIYLLIKPSSNTEPKKENILEKISVVIIFIFFLYLMTPKPYCLPKEKMICVQMSNLRDVINTFAVDNGSYPSTDEGIQALIKNPSTEKYPHYYGPYLYREKEPTDSWKMPFHYELKEGKVILFSSGEDHKTFTEDDIYLSECDK